MALGIRCTRNSKGAENLPGMVTMDAKPILEEFQDYLAPKLDTQGKSSAEELFRDLYRKGFLGEIDFEDRREALRLLRSGELKPTISVLGE